MKRQAILITAYKDFTQLCRLINSIHNFAYIYIHIDKKSAHFYKMLKNLYKDDKEIVIISQYKINWGGYNHILAILDLMNMAKDNKNIKYVHIISGQDFPLKNADFFNTFITNNNNIYITCVPLHCTNNKVMSRYTHTHFLYPFLNMKKRWCRVLDLCFTSFPPRKKIGKFSINEIYKGMIWSSFNIEVCAFICKYCINNSFLHDLKYCAIPEEVFLQTILMNSKYKSKIHNTNLRYTDWHYRNGSSPAILDETDLPVIKKTDALFGRKFDSVKSKSLIDALVSNIINNK